MKKPSYLTYIFFGALFGFILSRCGATNFAMLHDMFLFRGFQLFGVIGTAIPITAIGFAILKRLQKEKKLARPVHFPKRRLNPGTVPGSILFGIGWGLTGTCPGPAIIQVGEGHLTAIATVVGILVGNLAFRELHRRLWTWKPETCG